MTEEDLQKMVAGELQPKGKLPTQAEVDALFAAEEKLAAEKKTAELRTRWNAPKRQGDAAVFVTGEYIDWHQARITARARLKLGHPEKRGSTVSLIGNRGNGKTQLGVELMRETTGRQVSAYYTTSVEFFMHVKASYKSDTETELNVLSRYRKPGLLVIDEFLKRSDTPWENNLLFELINKRYGDETDTVLIDNAPYEEFVKAIGPSLSDRMNEGGGIIRCNWTSFRK